jgi:hypothetical protein
MGFLRGKDFLAWQIPISSNKNEITIPKYYINIYHHTRTANSTFFSNFETNWLQTAGNSTDHALGMYDHRSSVTVALNLMAALPAPFLLQLEDVLVTSEAGPGQLPLVLLAHLTDLAEVHGVVRHIAVLDVPLPERRTPVPSSSPPCLAPPAAATWNQREPRGEFSSTCPRLRVRQARPPLDPAKAAPPDGPGKEDALR